MAQPYTSVRILVDDLVGIRLSAASNSLWALQATARQYAFQAINDAIQQYPVPVTRTYWSAMFNTVGQFAGLPQNVSAVINVRDYSTGNPVRHYRIYATPNTTLLSAPDFTGQAVVRYASEVTWFPHDTTMAHEDPAYDVVYTVPLFASNNLTFDMPDFPGSGAIEMSVPGAPHYEVIEYQAVTFSTYLTNKVLNFRYLTHEVAGAAPGAAGWYGFPNQANISYAIVGAQQYIRPLTLAAQAAMYEYWMHDRANYDMFTAIASMQYMAPKEILQLINTYEARAMMMYRQAKSVGRQSAPADTAKLRTRLPK